MRELGDRYESDDKICKKKIQVSRTSPTAEFPSVSRPKKIVEGYRNLAVHALTATQYDSTSKFSNK
jgi:hypothetical protein